MEAILLALGSGFCAGALGPTLRWGLQRRPDAALGALASVGIGLAVAAAIAAASGQLGHVGLRAGWPFLALGVLAPGLSQVLFVRAIERLGPSRTLTAVSVAPLFAGIAAVLLLGEPFGVALAVGTVLIVLGGVTLGWERQRPAGFRPSGFLWAAGAMGSYAARDDILRWAGARSLAPLAGTTLLLASAGATTLLFFLLTRRGRGPAAVTAGTTEESRPAAGAAPGAAARVAAGWAAARSAGRLLLPFVPAGLAMGLAYSALVSAFHHGRVTVVSPVHGMYALWGVLLSAVFLRKTELISRPLVVAAALIVCGGALIGIFH